MTVLEQKALRYCDDVISRKELAPNEVVIQCKLTLDELEKQHNEDYPYFMDHSFLETVEGIMGLINFATGIDGVIGKTIIEGMQGFQAYFFYCVFGWKFKSDMDKYRYADVILFIPRKNAKTWMASICFIIYMLTEDKYTETYSISLDRTLASLIKDAMRQTLDASPLIGKYFKIPRTLSGKCECKITQSFYQPRTAQGDSNNGLKPSFVIADEVGAFKTNNNIQAMKSGMKNVKNKVVLQLTTAYANDDSIFLDELDYIKKVFNGTFENDRMFALLYYAPEEELWTEKGLYMSNPLRIEENYNTIREDRKTALEKPSDREEYLTKSMNHFVPTNAGEAYIDVEVVKKCKIATFDWPDRDVYVSLDLAMTNDNCSFSMATHDQDTGHIYSDTYAFIPKDRIQEKNQFEKVNYENFIREGKCYACGGLTVDYAFIEGIIMTIEERFGCRVKCIGYDRYNCLSTAMKLENEGYSCVEIKQHSSVLHPAVKLLEEYVLDNKYHYVGNNKLLEINFANAKCTYDTNLNRYVNKKKSTGKVDMVVTTIMCMYLIIENEILSNDFVVQTC